MDDEISGWECILSCKDLIWTVRLVDGSAYWVVRILYGRLD